MGDSKDAVVEMNAIRAIFPACCAPTASGAARRARVPTRNARRSTRVIARLHPAPRRPSPARSPCPSRGTSALAVVRCSSAFAPSPCGGGACRGRGGSGRRGGACRARSASARAWPVVRLGGRQSACVGMRGDLAEEPERPRLVAAAPPARGRGRAPASRRRRASSTRPAAKSASPRRISASASHHSRPFWMAARAAGTRFRASFARPSRTESALSSSATVGIRKPIVSSSASERARLRVGLP